MNNVTRENNISGRKFYCKKNTAKRRFFAGQKS